MRPGVFCKVESKALYSAFAESIVCSCSTKFAIPLSILNDKLASCLFIAYVVSLSAKPATSFASALSPCSINAACSDSGARLMEL